MSAALSIVARRRRGLWQATLLLSVLVAYSRIRGVTKGDYADALQNASEILHLQGILGLPGEAGVQAWATTKGPLLEWLSYSYVLMHFVGTTLVFVLSYRYAPRAFRWLRDTWIVASAMALPIYALVPTAPPRLTGTSGLADAVSELTPLGLESTTATAFYQPYAAIPSMHVGTALLVAFALGLDHRWRTKALLLLYPAYVTFTVIATGNHYWFDAIAGAAVSAAAIAVVALWRLHRAHVRADGHGGPVPC